MQLSAHTPTKRAEARCRYFTREEAGRLGWKIEHPTQGGQFLEEQEVVDYFPVLSSALGLERPDFAAVGTTGKPLLVIECKADYRDLDTAMKEACGYAETISASPGFDVRLATGIAGSPDRRISTRTRFRNYNGAWIDLESFGFPLTQLPTPLEAEVAIERADGTTDVQLPDEREFFDAAINISNLLRTAKIEESKRAVAVGSIILALWEGAFSHQPDVVLDQINANVRAAINRFADIGDRRGRFVEILTLGIDADGLRDCIEELVRQLERLNIRSIMRSGVDFLGQFYETFFRYACNTEGMGIVFTPRHITRFCANLARVEVGHKIYDPACGTGGFLVAAFDKMLRQAGNNEAAKQDARRSLFGRDTNATVWALAMLNMLFRGDGRSSIEHGSAFDDSQHKGFQRVLMNPPFSQKGEPEVDFIDHALAALAPGGIASIVVKTNVMVDPNLSAWRRDLVAKHHVLGVISLPPDLFYPTASSTVILVVQAHVKNPGRGTFLAIIKNDGFEISKKRRVSRDGSQLDRVLSLFHDHWDGRSVEGEPGFVAVVPVDHISGGEEICAEQWVPSEPFTVSDYRRHRTEALRQVALAIASYPDAVDASIQGYEAQIGSTDGRPSENRLKDWFEIQSGRSMGLVRYPGGGVPYISSGDTFNSIVGMIEPPRQETFTVPHLTVTAFGRAMLQPWIFCARGNGGSGVRVLRPIYRISAAEMLWFLAQLNAQIWRFHYGRMATVGRLARLEVSPPPDDLVPIGDVAARVDRFREALAHLAEDDIEGGGVHDTETFQ